MDSTSLRQALTASRGLIGLLIVFSTLALTGCRPGVRMDELGLIVSDKEKLPGAGVLYRNPEIPISVYSPLPPSYALPGAIDSL